jgi:hypothetical protein
MGWTGGAAQRAPAHCPAARAYLTSLLEGDALKQALRGDGVPDNEAISTIDTLVQASGSYRHSAAFNGMIDFIGRFRKYSTQISLNGSRPMTSCPATRCRWCSWSRFPIGTSCEKTGLLGVEKCQADWRTPTPSLGSPEHNLRWPCPADAPRWFSLPRRRASEREKFSPPTRVGVTTRWPNTLPRRAYTGGPNAPRLRSALLWLAGRR